MPNTQEITDLTESSDESNVTVRYRSSDPDAQTFQVAAFDIFESAGGPMLARITPVSVGDGNFEATFRWCEVWNANAWAVVRPRGDGYERLTGWQRIVGTFPADHLLTVVDALQVDISEEAAHFSFRVDCGPSNDLVVVLLGEDYDDGLAVMQIAEAQAAVDSGKFTATIALSPSTMQCAPRAWAVMPRLYALHGLSATIASERFDTPLFDYQSTIRSASYEVDGNDTVKFSISTDCDMRRTYLLVLERQSEGQWVPVLKPTAFRPVGDNGDYEAWVDIDLSRFGVEGWSLVGVDGLQYGRWPIANP